MRYAVHAGLVEDLRPLSKLLGRRLWLVVAPVILAISYAGAFIAIACVELIPVWGWLRFKSHSSDVPHWPPFALIVAMLTISVMIGRRAYRLAQTRIVSIDTIVLFLGSIVASAYFLCILNP